MNFNKFTIKAQETVQRAVELASQNGQQAIETSHILKALLEKGENVLQFLFGKLAVNTASVAAITDNMVAGLPKVSGGEPYLSRESNDVLLRAEELAQKDGDEFVSLEYLLLALCDKKNAVQKMLQDAGITTNALR